MTAIPTPPPPPAPTRAPGPSVGLSLIVGGVGLLVAIVAVIAIVVPLVGVFTSSQYQVPGTINLHLHHQRYTVYQRTGERSPFGISNPDGSTVRIVPTDLTVTAPDNSTVPVSYDDRSETITRGSTEYTSSLTFEPPSAGDYELRFTNRVTTTVVVARSISDAVRGVLVWFGVGALGAVILIAGLVMLIVGSVRRGSARRAAYASAWGAAGWSYAPPTQQWTPPAGAPGYPPSQYPPSQYPPPPPQYPPPVPPPPQYPPSQYPPPPAPPAPPPGEAGSDQPNP